MNARHRRYGKLMLGEVDTGFVIWYRAQKYQESAATMMNQAIASYSGFLVELKMRFEVVCISTPRLTHSRWQRLGRHHRQRQTGSHCPTNRQNRAEPGIKPGHAAVFAHKTVSTTSCWMIYLWVNTA
ncbi:MAG: hypothetical protein ACXV8J_01485 [Methylobacter sp.]